MSGYGLTEAEYQRILAFMRDIHQHPELSMREFRTTEKIKEALAAIPVVEILELPGSGVAAPGDADSALPLRTGVIARLRGTKPGPETMLRADIDALPQTELYDSPWKSVNVGVMHACGHDFHTASLLGAALLLGRAREDGGLSGVVDFVFQPAEEGTTGARALLDAGLFEVIHPDRCFGLHNWPSVESGRVVVHEGPLMSAKRNFTITICGAGGHGSMPHLNIDPIVCAAAVVQSLQTVVSRNTSPLDSVVLSINMIHGGSPVNLVVDQVEMRATIRSLSEMALTRAIERTETIVARTAEAYECGWAIDWKERIPAVINTPEMCGLARRAAERALAAAGTAVSAAAPMGGSAASPASGGTPAAAVAVSPASGGTPAAPVDAPPSLASEDFALYRERVPSFFYWVGSTRPGDPVEELHRPRFHADPAALRVAAALYAASAML